jgi:2-polyprenyl-3-methyl-5-hydroxy-6-metoxy-1,4-benzoquinol methylase
VGSVRAFYRDCFRDQEQGAPGPDRLEPTFPLRVGAALQAIGGTPRRILDFGCGMGMATRLLVDAGHTVVGVDVSESGIRLAARQVPAAAFASIDSECRLPFRAGAFDVCYCSEVIEHLLDVAGFVREVHRVLAAGGQFLVSTPYHGWLKNLALVTLNFEGHFDVTGQHIRFFTPTSLTTTLQAGGFRVDRLTGLGRLWPLWEAMFAHAHRGA